MNWQGLLKTILPEKLIEVNPQILNNLEEIKFASDNTSNKQTLVNNGTIIFINGGENDEASKIIEKISLDKLDKDDTVLEASAADKLQQVNDNFWKSAVQRKIALYESMIPPRDYHILEAAIFVQYLYDQGVKVEEYMRDISIRYGQRGSMICHLYSAEYFDSLIMPLYVELMQNDDPQVEEYNAVYEFIVTESPLALFVSRRDTITSIRQKVLDKIQLNQSAGINYLNIHGIGFENKSNILKALSHKDIATLLVGEPDISTKNSMTTVTIFFPVDDAGQS